MFPFESAAVEHTSVCSVSKTMSKRGASMSWSSLVSDRFTSLPLRKSSYVRISQNCGVTASRGMAASSGSNHMSLFIKINLWKGSQKPEGGTEHKKHKRHKKEKEILCLLCFLCSVPLPFCGFFSHPATRKPRSGGW